MNLFSPVFRSLFALLFLSGCYRASTQIEPCLPLPTHPKELAREKRLPLQLPDNFSACPFTPLTCQEEGEEWGKEYKIGKVFAADFDLYRAITAFKRALILMPEGRRERQMEVEYSITLAYYLGKKYVEVVHSVETGILASIDCAFPAFHDLLVMLYDSYSHLGRIAQRDHLLQLLENSHPESAEKFQLLSALQCADFPSLQLMGDSIQEQLSYYCLNAKSVRRAEFLNAVLPGAGYFYLGQKQSAVTAFLINSLFIGAAIAFFEMDNIPAGIITLSLEGGWYFGGIYGAGLAAKYYNERLYEGCVEKLACKEKLFPLMLLRYTF